MEKIEQAREVSARLRDLLGDWTVASEAADAIDALIAEPAAVPAELDVRRIMLDVVPGPYGEGLEVYAKTVTDIDSLLTSMGTRLEDYESEVSALKAELTRIKGQEPVATVTKNYATDYSEVSRTFQKPLDIGARLYLEAGAELVTHEQRKPLDGDQSRALRDARNTAMAWTMKGRIPECGEFGRIAQDLDWLCDQFGIKEQP